MEPVRNFAISFFVEACIAQPIARFVMVRVHRGLQSMSKRARLKLGILEFLHLQKLTTLQLFNLLY